MDVSNLSKYQSQAIVFNGVGFEMHLHQGRPKKKEVGRDVALAGAKALLAAYQGLVERHEGMIGLLETYDEVDIAGMIEAVQAMVKAKERLLGLYAQHANRVWIAEKEVLDEAYWVWYKADGKATKGAKAVYEMFVGPIPKIKIPAIPLELWTTDIRHSRYFYYIKAALCKRWGVGSNTGVMHGHNCRSHSDLVRFLNRNNYRMGEADAGSALAFNSRDELVGRIKRNVNPGGEDGWYFRYVNIYERKA